MKIARNGEKMVVVLEEDLYQVMKQCLLYCNHRMQKHPECGLRNRIVRFKFDKLIKEFNEQDKNI